jgi:hypothetical protein
MNEMNDMREQWLEGFVKAANDAGITDPQDVSELLILTKRATLASAHPEQFDAGIREVAAAAGIKEAGLGRLAMGAGALGLGALGLIGKRRSSTSGPAWNAVDEKDQGNALDAYRKKNIFSKAWTNVTDPAMMKAVEQQRATNRQADKTLESGAATRDFAQNKARKAQQELQEWDLSNSSSRRRQTPARRSSWRQFGNYYAR